MIMGKGKHRRPRGLSPRSRPVIKWVDVRTSLAHLLTPEAAAAGRGSGGRYIALCGADVIPASLTEPGRGMCQACTTAIVTIPTQKSRTR